MTKNKQKHTTTSIIKNSIKILSWNIQSPSSIDGSKFEIESFQNVFKDHDIACLQEIRREVHLIGYRSICNIRKDGKSGGVGILIKNELIEGIEFIKNTECSDYLVCRLNKDFFNLPEDTFIVNVYIRPFNSSASNATDNGKDALKNIEDVVNELREEGEVILCGDFNSRTGQKTGMIREYLTDFVPLPDDYEPDTFLPRNSLDSITNTYGTHFLNLVKHNQLTILNGRTLGDLVGNFTSIQKNGCSVIDYIAVTKSIKTRINYFKILTFTEHSDHRPLSTELKCNKFSINQRAPLQDTYQTAPTRYIINEENIESFFEAQSENLSLTLIHELQSNIDLFTNQTNLRDNDRNTETELKNINERFSKHLRDMASKCFKQSKPPKKSHTSNKPWFNWKTRLGKREFRKATDATSKFPSNNLIRENYYLVKGSYKRLKNSAKINFFTRMNEDIEGGKILNWQSFKKLKNQKKETLNFDSHDMNRFETFFGDLYSDKHKTVNENKKASMIDQADLISQDATHPVSLNALITTTELDSSIKSLKNGKASSLDMINNEIIKSLDTNHKLIMLNLFNACFSQGIYPWNASIISPLHKKGNKSDPDNYRAVAVSSVIGKLFSTILLERLILFRSEHCPDPPNQLGFTKKAQTYDHILTMKTIASKYKLLGKPVYAIFVDFKKAFDSVCRQALFLKLAKNGITGNFYNVLKNMYSNSYAYIKLSGHLSKRFQIRKGTEQGHPLSPDLFKVFLSDMSCLLDFPNCPVLSNMIVSHLLWADDLILLSLDQETTQKQLNVLGKFCNEWGIEINELKTQAVIFGKKTLKQDIQNIKFTLNGSALEIVDSYCYLGFELHQSGQVQIAQQNLKTKAMRAFFGLKRVIMRSKLSFKALLTLFDSLIKPILLYGAPIWTPTCTINKSLCKTTKATNNLLKKISASPQERVHISYLKWALGVHRKASNVGVWGETGRIPLIYQSIRLTLNYFKRLNTKSKSNSFVAAALKEQKSLNLPWYRYIKPLLELDEIYKLDHVTAHRILNTNSANKAGHFPVSESKVLKDSLKNQSNLNQSIKPLYSEKFRIPKIIEALTNQFKECWQYQKSISSKLSFYHSIKHTFNREPYLYLCKGFSRRYSTTKLRISAHDLHIEKGRYSNTPREQRICAWCQTSLGVETIENESHVLYVCDLYSKQRSKLVKNLSQMPLIETSTRITDPFNINELNLKDYLMEILSPYSTVIPQNHQSHHIHCHRSLNIQPNTQQYIQFQERRSYAVNCACTFFLRCSEERNSFTADIRQRNSNARSVNQLNIKLVRTSRITQN